MEEHKVRSVIHLLRISGKTMTDYMNALEEVMEELMDCYDQIDYNWRDNDKFLELMFRDGSFLLEVMRKFADINYGYYALNDPIFSQYGSYKIDTVILEDMLKIENQVPLLVLNKLVVVEKGITQDESTKYINELVIGFIRATGTFVFNVNEKTDLGSNPCMHMLDLARKWMVGDLVSHEGELEINMMSTTFLNRDAKVEFNLSEKNDLSGFAFDKEKGILYLPVINIYDCTESILLNLIAFEHLHAGISHHVSSYVYYNGGLIQSVNDFNLMRHKHIFCSDQDKEEIVKLIQKLQHDMGFIPKFTLFHVINPLDEYCERRTSKWQMRFRKWSSNFREKYFDSPWSFTALVAAAFIMAFTAAQTVYTTLSFYKSG
ncbi:UPF0481 protein At3g47200-like [Tasmannia lanceolata]|uniref:UPF0481 protein At3g47200-like n=1 Tax=Tasmannia lanceolata TaxID=3420 RepID=UPI004063034A